ncbi:MAG TPA: hypothetical protein VJS89_03875 [Gammaproteobacteria bacterium]|nr:hypothetical protein [Gammaproteobacteria bacterium]
MVTQTEWSAIAAIAATLAAIIAAIAILISIWRQIAESRRYRLSQSIELLLKLEDRFDSASFRNLRKIAARSAIEGNFAGLEPILDYFETVGLLLERGVLDEEMIWSTFSNWILNYAQIGTQYIAEVQAEDSTLWTYMMRLRDRMDEVQERITHQKYPSLTPDERENFLREEAYLIAN